MRTYRVWLLTAVLCLCHANAGMADQRPTYMLHCGGCHLADGRGNPPEVPSLRDDLGRILQVEGGRDYIVRVPGAAQAPVSNQAVADILNWILTEFNGATLGAEFSALSAQEVAAARERVLADPLKYRRQIWQRYLALSQRD